MSSEMKEAIKGFIYDKYKVTNGGRTFKQTINDADDLAADLNLDSLDVMEIIIRAESYAHVHIPNKKITRIHKVSDLCNLFEQAEL